MYAIARSFGEPHSSHKANGAKVIDLLCILGALVLVSYTAVRIRNATNGLKIGSGVSALVAFVILIADRRAVHPTPTPTPTPKREKLLSNAQKIVLFTSITANPATDGHIAMVDTVRLHFQGRGMDVVAIKIAIGAQSHVQSKARAREADGALPKPQRTYADRKQTLLDRIGQNEEEGMLEHCRGITEFYDDRKPDRQKHFRHSETYQALENQYPDATVVWVCGTDMYFKYGHSNWEQHGIMKHVAIVSRGNGDPDTEIYHNQSTDQVICFRNKCNKVELEEREDFSRVLLFNAHAQFASVSSTQVNEEEQRAKVTEDSRATMRPLTSTRFTDADQEPVGRHRANSQVGAPRTHFADPDKANTECLQT